MVDLLGKTRLTLNLSTFPNSLEPKTLNVNSDSKDSAKSPRNFEREVVGLGIVAAMNDLEDTNVSAKTTRTAILAVSPKSQPIPIAVPLSVNSAAKFGGEPMSGKDDMEMSESYTCVISNFGNNLIKKREYFDDEIAGSHRTTPVSSGVFSASPASHSKDYWAVVPFQAVDFLHSCYICKKTLQGLDIFMYRGEKAFCSAECRYKQMSIDEQREKCGPGAIKPLDRSSASPCSSPMHFFTGVAAA